MNSKELSVIPGFSHQAGENCASMSCYAASSGNLLATFRENLSVPPSRIKNPGGQTRSKFNKLQRAPPGNCALHYTLHPPSNIDAM